MPYLAKGPSHFCTLRISIVRFLNNFLGPKRKEGEYTEPFFWKLSKWKSDIYMNIFQIRKLVKSYMYIVHSIARNNSVDVGIPVTPLTQSHSKAHQTYMASLQPKHTSGGAPSAKSAAH